MAPNSNTGVPDTIATQIPNSPTGCQGLVVSNERHLIALGSSGDPRRIAWSDREDNTTWTASLLEIQQVVCK